MRTVTYRQVFNKVVRKYGIDPRKHPPTDLAQAIDDHINERVRMICQCWPWPQWILTEERAYRQVWNSTHQYMRANVLDGQPDEVFYIPNLKYYRVNTAATNDPPVGELPPGPTSGSTDFFLEIDPVDTFIAYDQTCRRSIGMVLSIFSQNPRVPTGSGRGGLSFMPSERGIDVLNAGNPTVFITYKMPVPKYTMTPYVLGKTYPRGASVLDPTVGECFQALAPTTAVPSDATVWRRIPFPEEWEGYVTQGAFADSLCEYDQGGNGDAQVKLGLAQIATQKADDLLQLEVDSLSIQGQGLKWQFMQRTGVCCESQPWGGGAVTELTEACQDELGWVYPTPSDTPMVSIKYYNTLVSVNTVTPNLIGIQTTLLLAGSVAEFFTGPSGARERQTWQLLAGGGNILDPGQVRPLDYNASTNNKHWEKASG